MGPPSKKPGPVYEEDDWNSESVEDDGGGPGREDEVEEVIQSTSVAGASDQSFFLFPERNEDNTGWLSPEGMNPCLQLNETRDIAQTPRDDCNRSGQKWFCRGPMTTGQSESGHLGQEFHKLSKRQKMFVSKQVGATDR